MTNKNPLTGLRIFLDWFFKNKQGKWVVVQVPNIPITVWILLSVVMPAIQESQIKEGVSLLRDAVLFTWSYLEITQGDSKFRRALGAVVLLAIVMKFF